MKLSTAVVTGLCAGGIGLPALAQVPATTITIGDLPAIGGSRVNDFATVTITENHPAAIGSGTFTLYFPDNPDQTVEFQSSSSVSGPATAMPATNYLIIEVDTDDTVTETFVIQAQAYFRTRVPVGPGFALMDGDPMGMNRTGVLDGVNLDRFELGSLGDIVSLEIGFREEVAVGETIALDIRTATGENTGPYTAETLDASIATAAIDGSVIHVTGVSPGITHAVVYDSLGRHDMVVVDVLAGSGGVTGGPSAPQPEPEEPAPLPETPEPVSPAAPDPDIAAAPGSAGTPPAEQEPGAQPADEPAPPPGGEPALVVEGDGAPLDGASSALELPQLGEATVVGGGGSTAVLTAGATANGTSFHDSFDAGDEVSILGQVMPEVAQIDMPGELFAVVRITTPAGSNAWFHKNGANWERWDGRLAALQPTRAGVLTGVEGLEIFDGPLQAGRYEIYLGYAAEGDALIYSGEPLVVEVR